MPSRFTVGDHEFEMDHLDPETALDHFGNIVAVLAPVLSAAKDAFGGSLDELKDLEDSPMQDQASAVLQKLDLRQMLPELAKNFRQLTPVYRALIKITRFKHSSGRWVDFAPFADETFAGKIQDTLMFVALGVKQEYADFLLGAVEDLRTPADPA